jgi:hypothetical protein
LFKNAPSDSYFRWAYPLTQSQAKGAAMGSITTNVNSFASDDSPAEIVNAGTTLRIESSAINTTALLRKT